MLSALNVSLPAQGAPSRRPPTAEGTIANDTAVTAVTGVKAIGDRHDATGGDASQQLVAQNPDDAADDDSGAEAAAAPPAAPAAGVLGRALVPHAGFPPGHEFAEFIRAQRAYESSSLMVARANRQEVGLVLDGRV